MRWAERMKNSLQSASSGLLLPWLLFSGLLALLLGMTPAAITAAQETAAQEDVEPARIFFDPAEIILTPGETVTVPIRIENAKDLYGFQVRVLFDPLLVTAVRISPGPFLPSAFPIPAPVVNQAEGRADLVLTLLSPSLPQSGDGILGYLEIGASDCLGLSGLAFGEVILSDNNGNSLPFTLENAQISSGEPVADRSLTGSIFHGEEEADPDNGLPRWPVYAQRFSLAPLGPVQMTLSDGDGRFAFTDLSCGQHQVWSQNGVQRVLTQTVTIPAAGAALQVTLPLTGTLTDPLQRLYLPSLTRE